MPFQGFCADTLAFLGDLAEHNDRVWFAENKTRYERVLLGPQRAYVAAVGSAFAGLDERVAAVPAVDRSIFRIHRDTRFSRDKSPYKTYADLFFWIGDERKSSPGYFVRLERDSMSIGCGAHMLTDAQIARYRAAVDDALRGARLEQILAELAAMGFEPNPVDRKTVPRGFSEQHPRAELLKRTQVHAIQRFSPPPAEFYGPEFVDWSVTQFRAVKPLVDWLVENLSAGYPADMRP